MRAAAIALVLGLAGCLSVPEAGGDAGAGAGDIPGPTAGLVAYWSMDSISDANVVRDAIGGHHGECLRCPTPYEPYVGAGALRFDGDAALLVEPSPAFDLPEGTVSAWIYYEGVTPGTVISQPLDELYNSWLISAEPGGTVGLEYPNSADRTSATLQVNAWNHIAASWDASARRIVVNGQPDVFAARAHQYAPLPLVIGADVDNETPAYHYTGAIDDLRVYDRVLSLGEIGQIFEL